MNFSKKLPNLKMTFSITFNLVSKLTSCPVTATDIAGARFILTILDAEEIAVIKIVEKEVRVTREREREREREKIAVSCGYWICCLIIQRRESE